jgi:hypothetical protein
VGAASYIKIKKNKNPNNIIYVISHNNQQMDTKHTNENKNETEHVLLT